MAKKAPRKLRSYPTDVSDEEWEFCVSYLTLMTEAAPQREHELRAIFNALRWMVRAGCPWRLLPNDLPPWTAVHQQTLRWIRAGCFEAMAHDLRMVLRELSERASQPTAVILDGRTVQSTPESGARAGYDGHKRRKGSKVHIAVDTLGYLLALKVTPANEQERAQVGALAQQVQAVTERHVQIGYVDQGYTGAAPSAQAEQEGIDLIVIKLPAAKRGFVLLPRRWVVERSFAWLARFRRLGRDYERLAPTYAGFHWLAFLSLMLNSLFR
jgi:transposase